MLSLLLPLGLLGLVFWRPEILGDLMEQLKDSWYEAGVYVAITLSLFYFLESRVSLNFSDILARKNITSLITASCIGAIPGCGGSIYVVLNFLRKKSSFGALVATLVATMGDSAFLLLARRPLWALGLIGTQIVAGFITGLIIDKSHGVQFLSPAQVEEPDEEVISVKPVLSSWEKIIYPIWYILCIPTVVLAFYTASGGVLVKWASTIFLWAGIIYTLGAIIKRIVLPDLDEVETIRTADDQKGTLISRKVFHETSFVVVWVFIANLFYLVLTQIFTIDIVGFFQTYPALAPLIGIAVGFIPGCGPQIVVTGLYVSDIVPFSAQLGNAISTDGDALFPALRLTPKAVIVATLYSAIPAFILAYTWNFFFE